MDFPRWEIILSDLYERRALATSGRNGKREEGNLQIEEPSVKGRAAHLIRSWMACVVLTPHFPRRKAARSGVLLGANATASAILPTGQDHNSWEGLR
jgi:hypothetical protein